MTMFEDFWAIDYVWVAATAVLVAGALALLPKSRLRFALALFWILLPAFLVLGGVIFGFLEDSEHWSDIIGLGATIMVVTLPLWTMLAGVAFMTVRRSAHRSVASINGRFPPIAIIGDCSMCDEMNHMAIAS